MRLADYIVSYSLQINNRCLRFLADSHAKGMVVSPDGGVLEGDEVLLEVQPVYVESMLVRDSRRLLSMWAWVATDNARINAHREELAAVVLLLTENAAPTRLALRLASQAASEEDATHLLMLARALDVGGGVAWWRLNELFTDDSDLWRDAKNFSAVADDALLERVFFSYRKGTKLDARLPRQWPLALPNAKIAKVLLRQKHFGQFSLHQLELLRPGLSEKGKRQLWYLDKLADAHRMLTGLQRLRAQVQDAELRKTVAKACEDYIDGQILKIHKRIERLSPRAYDQRPKKFRQDVRQSLLNLGLNSVHSLQQEKRQQQEDEQRIIRD